MVSFHPFDHADVSQPQRAPSFEGNTYGRALFGLLYLDLSRLAERRRRANRAYDEEDRWSNQAGEAIHVLSPGYSRKYSAF
jgi:hypothetical protein